MEIMMNHWEQSLLCSPTDAGPATPLLTLWVEHPVADGAPQRFECAVERGLGGWEMTCLIEDSLSPQLPPPSLEGIPGQGWASWSVTDSTKVFASKLLQKPLNILETICHFLLSVWKWKKVLFLKIYIYIKKKIHIGTSEDKLPLWCTRPFSTNAALSLQIAEVLLSSTSWRSNETKWGEAWGGEEEIQSNSAGVTFSHNPPQMLLVSGDRAAEGGRWEERWEAFRITLRREELKVVTFGGGGTSFCFVFFPHSVDEFVEVNRLNGR